MARDPVCVVMPFADVGYGPVTIALMTTVFESAWAEALASGRVQAGDDAARAAMAAAMLAAVDAGIIDERQLKEVALTAVPSR